MEQPVYQGSAGLDGAPFNGWFVGRLRDWRIQNGIDPDPEGLDLRDAGALEIKWGIHPKGQLRPGGWAGRTDKICLGLLVRGSFILRFRSFDHPIQELTHHLRSEGDYVIWREEVEHTWQAEEDSVILTVRWKPE